jgi:hypothetical protein
LRLEAKSSQDLITTENVGMVTRACHPSYQGRINMRILILASLGIKQDPISKITKRAGGVAQDVGPEFKL